MHAIFGKQPEVNLFVFLNIPNLQTQKPQGTLPAAPKRHNDNHSITAQKANGRWCGRHPRRNQDFDSIFTLLGGGNVDRILSTRKERL